MKYLALFITALITSACYTVLPRVYTEDHDIACSSDYDCPVNYYCGFKHVDTRPVCKQ